MIKKKISAEEKHYIKRNKKLDKEVKEFQKLYGEQYRANRELESKIQVLEDKLKLVEVENEKLKELVGVSDEEVRRAVSTSKSLDNLLSMTRTLTRSLF